MKNPWAHRRKLLVNMNRSEVVRYEELYLKCWKAQNIKDKIANPKLQLMMLPVQRKVVYPKSKALSKEANIVNNLMNHGLTAEEIVPALSMTPVEVNQLIERFELPRRPKGQRT